MRIIVLGSQGSGKSTQAALLSEKSGWPYIEMGKLLRNKAYESTAEGSVIKGAFDVGNLVPDQITIKTLHESLRKEDVSRGFVLDGYPRNYAQLEGLPKNIDRVFNIVVSESEAIRRLIERGRDDDNLKVITRRLELYHRESEPLLAYFKEQQILEEVDGERSIEEIHRDIMTRVQNLVRAKSNEKH